MNYVNPFNVYISFLYPYSVSLSVPYPMEVPQNGVVVWISDTTASLHLEELCELIDIFDAQRWDAVPHKL